MSKKPMPYQVTIVGTRPEGNPFPAPGKPTHAASLAEAAGVDEEGMSPETQALLREFTDPVRAVAARKMASGTPFAPHHGHPGLPERQAIPRQQAKPTQVMMPTPVAPARRMPPAAPVPITKAPAATRTEVTRVAPAPAIPAPAPAKILPPMVLKTVQGAMAFNPQQAAAITRTSGAYALNAGAGSGKTRVITERVGQLIEHGLTTHSRVLVLTFTVKAAEEFSTRMKERTGHRLPWATNFHRLCVRLLRDMDFGIPKDFAILDGPEQENIMSTCLRTAGVRGKGGKKGMRAAVTDALNALEATRMAGYRGVAAPADIDRQVARAISLYESGIRNRKAVDFDLMLHAVARGMRQNAKLAAQVSALWDFVLVDEMQDTSLIQLEMLKLIAPHGNIMGVGDMDQGIYAFRGAVPENLMTFVRYFGAQVLPLEYNYRSKKEILDLANLIISKGANRIPKTLRDVRGNGGTVDIRKHDHQAAEATHVAASIRSAITRGVDPSNIAVIFRINAMSRGIEAALAKAGVTYGMKGGLKFWDRPIVKDVVALARVLAGDESRESWERAMARPPRKAGTATVEQAVSICQAHGLPMQDAFARLARQTAHQGIAAFLQALSNAKAHGPLDGSALERFLELVGYNAYMEESAKDDADLEDRRENVAEVVNAAKDAPDLRAFLTDVDAGMAAGREDDGSGGITLGTVHSVKGLEYTIVHLVGCHEGGIPFVMALKDPDQLEEERRLMYVAITRAKDELHIHCPIAVVGLDGRKRTCQPSSFLDGVDAALNITVHHDPSKVKADTVGTPARKTTRKKATTSSSTKAKPRAASKAKPKSAKSTAKEPAWMKTWRAKK